MPNDALLWYLIGRRRGKREAINQFPGQPIRPSKRRSAFWFVLLALVLVPALVGVVALAATLLERIL